MADLRLTDTRVREILQHLGCPVGTLTLRYLNRLIRAYTHTVPWESVSRIIKRHTTKVISDCPRWPEEFWRDAIEAGTGGTCFESSLAFFSLLISLGCEGYLTVNDMGTTRACHAAVVVLMEKQKYLVDITIPVYGAVRFEPGTITRRNTGIFDYTIYPVGNDRYQVKRSHNPNGIAFTLVDTPVSLPEYEAIVQKDYEENGRFLKSVVMVKIMEGRVWRFFSDHIPYRLESFNRSGKYETLLPGEMVSRVLAERFQLPEDKLAAAFSWVQSPG